MPKRAIENQFSEICNYILLIFDCNQSFEIDKDLLKKMLNHLEYLIIISEKNAKGISEVFISRIPEIQKILECLEGNPHTNKYLID